MSVTLSPADQEAVNAFKACFGIKAEPIVGAYEEVAQLTRQAEGNRRQQEQVTTRRTKADGEFTKLHNNRMQAKERSGKEVKANPKEVEAGEVVAECDAELKRLADDLVWLEVKLANSTRRKEADPWKEYQKQVRSLEQRLAKAGLETSAIAEGTWEGPVQPFKGGNLKGFEAAVRKQGEEVEALCMPIERQKKRNGVEARLSALEKLPYKDGERIDKIRGEAQVAEVAGLDGSIEAALAGLEDDCEEFPQRLQEAGDTLAEFRRDGLLPERYIDDADGTLQELRKAAGKRLDGERLDRMLALEEELEELTERAGKIAEDRDRYEQEAKEAKEEASGFLGRSNFHNSYKLGMDKAYKEISEGAKEAGERNFKYATKCVERARALLSDWDAKAWQNVKKQGDAKLLKDEQERKRQQEAEDRQKVEDAKNKDDIAALNLIGKKSFGPWLAKAGKLYAANVIDFDKTDPEGLNGQKTTIEIIITLKKVNQGDPEIDDRTFVVHYHPRKMKKIAGLTKKDAEWQAAKNSSPLHSKPDKHSKVRVGLGSWLEDSLPSINQIGGMV